MITTFCLISAWIITLSSRFAHVVSVARYELCLSLMLILPAIYTVILLLLIKVKFSAHDLIHMCLGQVDLHREQDFPNQD